MPEQGHVQHVVVMWLKPDTDEQAVTAIIETSRTFTRIPGVLEVHAGRMLPSERPIVDSTFDIAMVMTFRDRDAMQRYLTDPEHQKAAGEVLRPYLEKMAVYDFEESK